jgi:integrase
MIKVTKRKDGRYMKRVSIKGNLKTIYGNSPEEVVDEYIRIKYENKKGTLASNTYTFKEWTEIWLDSYKTDIQATTKNDYRSLLRTHAYPQIGAMKLDKIKQFDITNVLQEMSNKGITKRKNELLILIKSILNKAVENDLINKNVAQGITLKKHKSKEKQVISDDIIKCLKNESESNEKAFMILFLIYTGLRRGEICSLTKEDIDLKNNLIRINKASSFPHNQPVTKSTKNEETRYVPIFNIIKDELKQLLKTKEKYIFTNKDGNKMSAVCIRRKLESINTLLNKKMNEGKEEKDIKDYSITLHQTRHTFASILHDAGIDVKQAQQWTGHKDIRVLLDIYTHLNKNQNQIAVEKVNNFIG